MTYISTSWTTNPNIENTYSAFVVGGGGARIYDTNEKADIYIVATLNQEILLKEGNGSLNNPYIVNTF